MPILNEQARIALANARAHTIMQRITIGDFNESEEILAEHLKDLIDHALQNHTRVERTVDEIANIVQADEFDFGPENEAKRQALAQRIRDLR